MRIELVRAEEAAEYIRYARQEILGVIGGDAQSALAEPIPCGFYLLAYDRDSERPVGMAEVVFHDQLFRSYEEDVYCAAGDLPAICPFGAMCHIRSLYVERSYRRRCPLYTYLALAAAHLFKTLGARFSTAGTLASDAYLTGLYEKTGASRVGSARPHGFDEDLVLYTFDLEKLTSGKAMRRLLPHVRIDFDLARAIRGRRLVAA